MDLFKLPPIPVWAGFHPLVVHFPIALLLTLPVLLLLTLLLPAVRRGLLIATLAVLIMGTASAWVAVLSGQAAEDAAADLEPVQAILPDHEDGGKLIRNIYTGMSILYAGFAFVVLRRKDEMPTAPFAGVQLVFLAASAAGCLLVANVGHLGGRMVHQYGMKAPIASKEELKQSGSGNDSDDSGGGGDESAGSGKDADSDSSGADAKDGAKGKSGADNGNQSGAGTSGASGSAKDSRGK